MTPRPSAIVALGALAERYALPGLAVDQLAKLVELVTGDAHSPTTVRAPPAVIDDHIADSLVALELPHVRDAGRIADLGAGAGFPGLPLVIALPAARAALVESNTRKCAFIARAVAECGLQNAEVVNARAEEWPEGAGVHDVVTARALAPLAVVAEYAAPLLRIGGWLVAWRGRREADAEDDAARAADALGMEIGDVVPVRPYPTAERRHLHLVRKVAETPSGFPRRPGIARKRPLGGTRKAPSDR